MTPNIIEPKYITIPQKRQDKTNAAYFPILADISTHRLFVAEELLAVRIESP